MCFLVSNASAQLVPDNTLSSFTNLLPEQLNPEGQREVAISETSYPSMYQNVTQGQLMFSNKMLSEFFYLEPRLYFSIAKIVEAMNTLLQERRNHNENCFTVKVSQRTKKVEIYLEIAEYGLAFFQCGPGTYFRK